MPLLSRLALPLARRVARPPAPAAGAPAPAGVFAALDDVGHVIAAYGPERLLGRGDGRASDRALRAAARGLAAEARARDAARAERLLLDLKRAWPALPAVQAVPDLAARRALWDRLVLLCCEEFYAPARPGAPSSDAPVA
jgi:hypothetical protein